MTCTEKLFAEHPEWSDVVVMKCLQTFTPNEYFCITGPGLVWFDEYPFEGEELADIEPVTDEFEVLSRKYEELKKAYDLVKKDLADSIKLNANLKVEIELKDEWIANQKSTIKDYIEKESNDHIKECYYSSQETIVDLENKVRIRDEEIDKLVEENNKLSEKLAETDKHFNSQVAANAVLYNKVSNLEKQVDEINDSWNACAEARVKDVKNLEKLKDNIEKMGFEVDENNNITDIVMTRKLAEQFDSFSSNCALSATDITRAIAKSIRSKYEALIYVGFSHDDALKLAVMWKE